MEVCWLESQYELLEKCCNAHGCTTTTIIEQMECLRLYRVKVWLESQYEILQKCCNTDGCMYTVRVLSYNMISCRADRMLMVVQGDRLARVKILSVTEVL